MSRLEDLEFKAFMQTKLVFANNAISLCFFFFFLIIGLYFLMFEIITEVFDPIVELMG